MESKPRISLCLEALEPRLLLSVAPVVTDANIEAFLATDAGKQTSPTSATSSPRE